MKWLIGLSLNQVFIIPNFDTIAQSALRVYGTTHIICCKKTKTMEITNAISKPKIRQKKQWLLLFNFSKKNNQ